MCDIESLNGKKAVKPFLPCVFDFEKQSFFIYTILDFH